MGQVLRLANEDQTTIINFLDGPIRWRGGWTTTTPGQGGTFTYEPYGAQWAFGNFAPVTETLDVVAGGSGADVIAALDRLLDFLEAIRLFHAGDLAAKSCWLEWSAEGELPKRALLYSATFKVVSQANLSPMLADCQVLGTLTLTRHPLWENPTRSVLGAFSSLSTLGGKWDFAGVTGNVPARIGFMQIHASAGANLYRHWIGIRKLNQGVSGFVPVWECEDGTNGTDAADAADLTASDGNKVTVTYATTTLASRMTITVSQVVAATGGGASIIHHQGRYLVLCRCKVSAGTTGIQMRSGYTGNVPADEVYIDNTNWRLIPLGNISIPPWEGNDFNTAVYMGTFRIDLWAEEMNATAGRTLDVDCLVLIPSEHLLTLEGSSTGSTTYDDVWALADDTEVAYELNMATPAISDAIDSGFTDWHMPPGSGTIIVAAEDQTIHHLAETVTLSAFQWYPRWLLYRGE